MTSTSATRRIWSIPIGLGVVTLAGLLSALLGESLIWKAIAWAALALPLGVTMWFCLRRR